MRPQRYQFERPKASPAWPLFILALMVGIAATLPLLA